MKCPHCKGPLEQLYHHHGGDTMTKAQFKDIGFVGEIKPLDFDWCDNCVKSFDRQDDNSE